MLRTVSPGHSSNTFTDGNPSLNIPATVFDAVDANFHQEEICNAIEGAGIALSASDDQLLAAILALASASGTQVSFAIANNNSPASAVTGLIVDKTLFKAAFIKYSIDRHTASSNLQQTGQINLVYDETDLIWRIEDNSNFDDAGVVFSVDTSTGQVKYTSSNLAGASYSGTMKSTLTKLNI